MKLFGTDGIRGTANEYPVTAEMALKMGRAAAHILKENEGRKFMVIGRDTRLSGTMLESALTSGILSQGINVALTGIIPTPAIAFMTRTLRAQAGIVISASHNPFDDNGIKFFSSQGFKLPDEVEGKIETLIQSSESDISSIPAHAIGGVWPVSDAQGRYVEYLKTTVSKGMTLNGVKVVLDCANGAAFEVGPLIFQELGAEVIPINNIPDGKNINLNCGSTSLRSLQEAVHLSRADMGVAFDGDADRVLFCDEKGQVVDGDQIMGLCSVVLKNQGMLNGNTLVSTVMSNVGLERYLETYDIKMLRTKVGDRYVVEAMKKGNYSFGGEQSGHIIFLDHNTTGDGILTALQVLSIIKKSDRPFSDLVSSIILFPQVLINVTVSKKRDIQETPELMESIKAAEARLKGGRILVRPSGTEPKIRVMVEGEDETMINKVAQELADTVKHFMV
jgi:phosphoglucosamine mutase